MPKINKMLFKLVVFQYAILIYLNVGYCHIQLTEDTSSSCKIIL